MIFFLVFVIVDIIKMFRYMRLVDMLRDVIEKGKQVKDVVYRNSKLNKT